MIDMKKMLSGKKKEENPMKMQSKVDALKELREMLNGKIGEGLPGLKKVTVASPTEEGMKEGLDVAKDVVAGDESEEEPEEEMAAEGEMDEEMPMEHSEEGIMKMIEMLPEEERKALWMKIKEMY